MTPPTTAAIRTRLEALCALVPGIQKVLTSGNKDLPDAACPALEVLIGTRVTRRSVDQMSALVTYDWEIWLYVGRVEKADNWQVADAAIDATDPWIDAVPDFFKARPRLELNDSGLVSTTAEMSIGRGIFPYRGNGKDYSGGRFILPVTILRSRA